jgi:hypothetical protein
MHPEKKDNGKRDASQASLTSDFPHAKKSATDTAVNQPLSSDSLASTSASLSFGMCDATVHRFIIFLSCFYLTLSLVSSMFCWIVIFIYTSVIVITLHLHRQHQLYSI